MALNITAASGESMSSERLISVIAHNFRQCLNIFLSAKQELRAERQDSEYNEFGEERRYGDPYHLSLAEAEEKYERALAAIRKFIAAAAEALTFPSLDVADELAETLARREPDSSFSVRVERDGELEFLAVCKNGKPEYIVDTDRHIDGSSRRNMFDDEKSVDGRIYTLYSFIPEEYKDIYDYYKANVRGTVISSEE